MFDDHDVAVVDDYLPRKKNRCLQSFAKCDRDLGLRIRQRPELRLGKEIGERDSGNISANDASDARTDHDRDQRTTQPHQSFEHQVISQMPEIADTLKVAAPRPQWNVEGHSD